MMLSQPPFPADFAHQNGSLTQPWQLWMNNIHLLLKLQGQSFTVASLPNGTYSSQSAFASNGRKSGEGAGAGTGIPAWWDGTMWRTFYDNSQVRA